MWGIWIDGLKLIYVDYNEKKILDVKFDLLLKKINIWKIFICFEVNIYIISLMIELLLLMLFSCFCVI